MKDDYHVQYHSDCAVTDFLLYNAIRRMGAPNKIISIFALIIVACSLSVNIAGVEAAGSNERKSLDTMNDIGRDMGIPIVTQETGKVAGIPILKSNGLTTLSRFISEAIKYVSVLAMIAITWGGFTYITAYGDEKKVGKAKNIILYSLFAVIIAISAYAIIDVINNLSLKIG